MDDLLREAIADAKAVRETALENAKIALEEAFTPRLQSMLSKKIAAEVEDNDEESKKFCESDINDILKTSARVVTSKKSESNGDNLASASVGNINYSKILLTSPSSVSFTIRATLSLLERPQ